MKRTPIAAMSVSTQKGLLGLYGMGLLFVRKSWAERLEPAYLSRFSVDLGTAHEATGGSDNYALMPGAKRFEVGNYNFLAATAVEPGLSMINELTTAVIEQHVLTLIERMITGLQRIGLPVFAAEPGPHRAHMVAIGDAIGNQHDLTDNPAMQSLYDALATGASARRSVAASSACRATFIITTPTSTSSSRRLTMEDGRRSLASLPQSGKDERALSSGRQSSGPDIRG